MSPWPWWLKPHLPRPPISPASFEQSPYFEAAWYAANIQEAEQAMRRGEVNGIVWLRSNFSREFFGADAAPIGVIVNGVDANTGRIIQGYVEGVWGNWLAQYAAAQGQALKLPVQVEQRVWFNPGLRSRDFLVPGLLAVIMTLIGALLTALVVAREWERGTMEALLVTPVTVREILLGKLIPYFFLGMGGMLLSVAMTVFLFDVPLRGSLWVLLATSALFLLAALGMGLLISTVARDQFVAGQVAILIDLFAGLSPVGLHLRHRQHAGPHPGDHPCDCRALLCGHSADGVPGRQCVVGDRRQCAGPGADRDLFPDPGETTHAQAVGLETLYVATHSGPDDQGVSGAAQRTSARVPC